MEAFICDAIRTPIGRYGGTLSSIRTDDLAALPISALMERNPDVDWKAVDDIMYGCTNQAGEDNRNVARMAGLLAGLPVEVGGVTINRLCGSGMEAVGQAARAVKTGEADLIVAGGVESMSRAPWVVGKGTTAFSRDARIHDSTIGWRFENPRMVEWYGVDEMPETAENVSKEFDVAREDQDAFALRSQQRVAAAQDSGRLAEEILPVEVPVRKGAPIVVDTDEHPRRDTSLEKLAGLRTIYPGGTGTAGNASGINDGSCALVIASADAAGSYGMEPKARVIGMAVAGVPPRTMGTGPVPATEKLLKRIGMSLGDFGVVELNEAFASQALAVLRSLGIPDDSTQVNPNGGAIALGHPLGMTGARLVATTVYEMLHAGHRFGLATMCIGVGQGIAMALELVA